MKKKSRSSVRRRPVGKNLKPIPDSQIDFTDIPELSDKQLAAMQRIGRSLEEPSKSRRQVVTKKLQQLQRRSATLTGNEILTAVQSGRKRADR